LYAQNNFDTSHMKIRHFLRGLAIIYPLYLESLKCGMKDPTKNKAYTLTIKDIILCYRDWAEFTGLESLSASLPYSLSAQKIMVNGQLYILKNNKIYTIHGNESK